MQIISLYLEIRTPWQRSLLFWIIPNFYLGTMSCDRDQTFLHALGCRLQLNKMPGAFQLNTHDNESVIKKLLSNETVQEKWHLHLLRTSYVSGMDLFFCKSWASKRLRIFFVLIFPGWFRVINVPLLRMNTERGMGNMWYLSNFQDKMLRPPKRKLIQNMIWNIC